MKPKKVDSIKSCDAFAYELASIESELKKHEKEAEELRNRSTPLHIFALSIGAAISLQPHLMLGDHFYIAPAATVTYYNLVASTPDVLIRYDYLSERKSIVEKHIKEKECQK